MNPIRSTAVAVLATLSALAAQEPAKVLRLVPAPATAAQPAAGAQDKRAPIYDEAADANELVAAALVCAKRDNKRVLLMYGGNWCGWCYKLDETLTKDPKVRRKMMYEYELVQLTGTAADTFATRHGFAAAVQHKPAAIVLDQGGSALAQLLPSLVTAEPATFAAALKGFSCAPVDAEAKLAAALADAKETGRNVFVRFDAPW